MSDLDLPLLPSADQIRRRQFATVRRGYDPDQVQEYLNQVALQVETLEGELREERVSAPSKQATAPEAKPAPVLGAPATAAGPTPAALESAYEQLSKRFANVLKAADEQAQKLIDDAKTESKQLVDDARIEADKIRVDAQANAEDARAKSAAELKRAKEEADRTIGGLEQRRESLLEQMHEMQSRLLAVAQNLEIPDDDAGTHAAASGAHASESKPTTEAPGAPASTPAPMTPSMPNQSMTPQSMPPQSMPPQSPQPSVPQNATPGSPSPSKATQPAEPVPAPVGASAGTDDDVDPRYEDLWATSETRNVDIPDLSSLDIDFDDEKE